jgi:radical SAM superfamily enzyme YgiQ (UPF0313 family)
MKGYQGDKRAIYLVQPKFPPTIWGMDYLLKMTPYHAIFPPLGLLTLTALTPSDFKVTICDENAGEQVDYNTSAQLVGITGYLLQMSAVLAHADQFRKRGKTVILGGPVANLLPEVCRPHCDVLFEGEAEYTWPRFLSDYARGRWDDRYAEPRKSTCPIRPRPAWSSCDAVTRMELCSVREAVLSVASSATSLSSLVARCASNRSTR